MMPALWKRHFLIFEGALAIVLTIVFAVWFWRFGGMTSVFALLQNNRATLYGTIASIFGSLLGFVITATSVVLGFAASENLSVVRESAQYPMLWRTFSATIRALAGATLVALLCLLVDRDAAPVPWLVVLLVLAVALSMLRIGRTIWVLEHIILLVTKKTPS
jgi:hypothetical protein